MSRIANGERRVKHTIVECNNKVIHRGYSLQDDIHGHYAQQETIACMHDFTIEKYPFHSGGLLYIHTFQGGH